MFNLYSHNQNELKLKISQNYRSNEKDCVENLLQILHLSDELNDKATILAKKLISKVRDTREKSVSVDLLMQEFRLSSNEGIALMCLAESLLRIPDKLTQDKLIRDKTTQGDWANYTKTNHLFVNAASWGLLITSKLSAAYNHDSLTTALLKVVAIGGEPLIRKAMRRAVKLMGNQFVMGETIEDALKSRIKFKSMGYNFSFDMLGEAAMNEEYAAFYMQSYIEAIIAVGTANTEHNVHKGAGVSVKLSAIYPRYQRSQYHKVISELYYRLKKLYLLAKEYNIALFIDAEEADRLEISLELLEMLLHDPELQGFAGIGYVVQAYQKRAPFVIHYIAQLAQETHTKIMLRLVKGAYWDSEIKKAQVEGQIDYPVFTRKFYTDLSYLACAQILLNYQEHIYPLFATHNAHSLAVIYYMFEGRDFEFQCLYGMGETLYNNVVGKENLNVTCRVYAPVGKHDTLLAYLVRRLLENGANSSFVHQILDKNITNDQLVINPVLLAQKAQGKSNPHFTKPAHIYPLNRLNSRGVDLSDEIVLTQLQTELNKYEKIQYLAHPLLANYPMPMHRDITEVINPANKNDKIGEIIPAIHEEIELAIRNAENGFAIWSETPGKVRAKILLTMADQLEENYYELLNILVREAGKTLANSISEVREAVDFCRYYANCVMHEFNDETHQPLGVFICISPWNFPLAIFIGQISSCLVAGNAVIAKPSYQTNLIAFYAVKLFHKAGIPENVLQLMPGSGQIVGNGLTLHPKISGVVFTGSTEVAQAINRNLASRDNEAVLIAETGGQNAMIVDSSALPEQVVADVLSSGFDSAGQRCSALRVLYLQADIADLILSMLKGAMDDLRVGDPANLATDIGPVIDSNAQQNLLMHIENMKKCARMVHQTVLGRDCDKGNYVPPTLIEIGSIDELDKEVFGPIIHVIRFTNEDLDLVINE
ncbi:MAG: bifunctional proline dehydrogenase/L-glutamate gamma-semialdehyde dehydrogenase PutA, partial [Burkholderiales bacterium]|nr:bifunctional proline dehydrogenase/L-glutamate gamma-semialdehyde dehydrogenase PutA [Burkholderiales bacterium]